MSGVRLILKDHHTLPFVERGARNPMLAAHIRRHMTGLIRRAIDPPDRSLVRLILQDADDLLPR